MRTVFPPPQKHLGQSDLSLNPVGLGTFGETPADLPGGAENIVENSDNGASPGDEGENEEE